MTSNVFRCGNAWQTLADPEAGWELVRHLSSVDIDVRHTAQEFLVQAGPRSIKLLQSAFACGALEPEVVAHLWER